MSIFGDPQAFLKQASSKNNTLGRDMSNNSTYDLSSATPTDKQTSLGDQSADNAKLSDGMNKDMANGPNTMNDKAGIKSSSKFDANGDQRIVQAGSKDMKQTKTTTHQSEEQSGMADWIKKKVMGGTDNAPTGTKSESGTVETQSNPNSPLPLTTEPDAQTPPSDVSKMPKPPEPPPHQSNIPKGGRKIVNNLPKNNIPKVPKQGKMPNLSIPKLPSFRR